MKSRPRSCEREVAKHLTELLSQFGISKFERIPILGRTGPDITVNESKLVIDVKSRLEVPKGVFGPLYETERYIAVPLDNLLDLASREPAWSNFSSVLVDRWFDHMDEWTRENCRDGITCLVLHRPKKPIGKAQVVINKTDRRRLCQIMR